MKNDKVNSEMYILTLGNKVNEWIKAETSGFRPSPRYQHAMVHSHQLNSLIIHGGRSKKLPDLKKRNGFYLSDMHLLNLETFSWLRVDLFGEKHLKRASHQINLVINLDQESCIDKMKDKRYLKANPRNPSMRRKMSLF